MSKARLYVCIYAECCLKCKRLQKVLQTLPFHSVDNSWLLFLVHVIIFGSTALCSVKTVQLLTVPNKYICLTVISQSAQTEISVLQGVVTGCHPEILVS